jgi:hypothetical protein
MAAFLSPLDTGYPPKDFIVKSASSAVLIEKCYQRGLDIFQMRAMIAENSITNSKTPVIQHLELYEFRLRNEHPVLCEAVNSVVQAFFQLDCDDGEKASSLFQKANECATNSFRDLHSYEYQCLATRIRLLSAIIR